MTDADSDLAAVDDALADAIADVYPPELGRHARRAVESSDPNPALLATAAARRTRGAIDTDGAVGIQLLHTGLALTSGVVDDPTAWEDVGPEVTEEDMELLAADVLVTLGFDHLVDHYDVATRVVNDFGREKAGTTDAEDPEAVLAHERALLASSYGAAVAIGADGDPPAELVALAEALAAHDALTDSRAVAEATAAPEAPDRVGEAARAVREALATAGVRDGYHDALLDGDDWRQQRAGPTASGSEPAEQ